jgi:hypothetical protein
MFRNFAERKMERLEITVDDGGPLVRVRNMADGDEYSVRRSRLRRHDGCWVLLSERRAALAAAARNRKVAKAAESKTAVLA